jgi:hypothetical protein
VPAPGPKKPVLRLLSLSWWPSSTPASQVWAMAPVSALPVKSVWLKVLVRLLALLYALSDAMSVALTGTVVVGKTFW